VEVSVQNVLEDPGDTGLLMVDLRELSGRRGLTQPTRLAYRDAFAGLFAYEPPMRNGGVPARSHNPTG